MERSVSMTHELDAIGTPDCEELEGVRSLVRSRSAEPQTMCEASDSDAEEDAPESPVATHDASDSFNLEAEKPFSSPSVVGVQACCI